MSERSRERSPQRLERPHSLEAAAVQSTAASLLCGARTVACRLQPLRSRRSCALTTTQNFESSGLSGREGPTRKRLARAYELGPCQKQHGPLTRVGSATHLFLPRAPAMRSHAARRWEAPRQASSSLRAPNQPRRVAPPVPLLPRPFDEALHALEVVGSNPTRFLGTRSSTAEHPSINGSNPMASSLGRGSFFRPEEGDAVCVQPSSEPTLAVGRRRAGRAG
jgi:hypothetical protein